MKELGINRSTQTHIDTQIRDEKKGKNSKKSEYEWETRAIVQSEKKKEQNKNLKEILLSKAKVQPRQKC